MEEFIRVYYQVYIVMVGTCSNTVLLMNTKLLWRFCCCSKMHITTASYFGNIGFSIKLIFLWLQFECMKQSDSHCSLAVYTRIRCACIGFRHIIIAKCLFYPTSKLLCRWHVGVVASMATCYWSILKKINLSMWVAQVSGPIGDQIQYSPFNLYPVMCSTVWRKWQVIFCWG